MRSGLQYRYCPNCGKQHYDSILEMNHVKSMCCDKKCRDEWELKYARSLLGRSAAVVHNEENK